MPLGDTEGLFVGDEGGVCDLLSLAVLVELGVMEEVEEGLMDSDGVMELEGVMEDVEIGVMVSEGVIELDGVIEDVEEGLMDSVGVMELVGIMELVDVIEEVWDTVSEELTDGEIVSEAVGVPVGDGSATKL